METVQWLYNIATKSVNYIFHLFCADCFSTMEASIKANRSLGF